MMPRGVKMRNRTTPFPQFLPVLLFCFHFHSSFFVFYSFFIAFSLNFSPHFPEQSGSVSVDWRGAAHHLDEGLFDCPTISQG